jgi:hypothetical protein
MGFLDLQISGKEKFADFWDFLLCGNPGKSTEIQKRKIRGNVER